MLDGFTRADNDLELTRRARSGYRYSDTRIWRNKYGYYLGTPEQAQEDLLDGPMTRAEVILYFEEVWDNIMNS